MSPAQEPASRDAAENETRRHDHTPTPWMFTQDNLNTLNVHFDPGTPRAIGEKICSLFAHDEITSEMWANAEFICRAVNCHGELVAALKDWWAEATGRFADKSCGHQFNCICISEKVRAAIAKAGGK